MKKKCLAGAVVIAVLASGAANAVTVGGQIDIAGNLNVLTSQFDASGSVDFEPSGIVVLSNGALAGFATAFSTFATLFDSDFTNPGAALLTVGGFTFTPTYFDNFVNLPSLKGFSAFGTITGNGYDPTLANLSLTSQPGNNATQASFLVSLSTVPLPASILLLTTTLIGFGMFGRKHM